MKGGDMKDKRITAKEAAKIIGVEYQTLLVWSSTKKHGKKLPFHKTSGGRLYLMLKNVEKFAKEYSI
jgi:predicted site-specific integrase-resolvase